MGQQAPPTYDFARSQYAERVPDVVREDVETKMERWRREGRDDEVIENLVRSLVLFAYASGRSDAFAEVGRFCEPRGKPARTPG